MAEVVIQQNLILEQLLAEIHANEVFANPYFGASDFERLQGVSRLFVDLLRSSGFTNEAETETISSLGVVITGGNYYEIPAVLLAAQAVGISQVNVTCIEILPSVHKAHREELEKMYNINASRRETEDLTFLVGNHTVRYIRGDSANSVFRNQIAVSNDTAHFAFIGNTALNMDAVVANWALVGQESGKPFLFAVTTANRPGERERNGQLFSQALNSGQLTPIRRLYNTPNPHTLRQQVAGQMTHSFIFAAIR